MASDKPVQDAFLAAIEAKIAAWQAVAASYRAAVSLDGPLGEPGAVISGVGHASGAARAHAHGESVLPVGVFRDKTIKEAITIYLGAGRRKQTNKEIAVGLQKGGIATTSTNFEATVATALYRLKEEGTILRFPDGWDLASSYPDNLRSRLEKDAKPRRSAKPKKTREKTSEKSKSVQAKSTRVKAEKPVGGALDARILAFLKDISPAPLPLNDVGDAVSESDAKKLSLAIARLTRYGKVLKTDDGMYRAAVAA